MNCNECLEKLDSYVDRELSEVELAEVKQHLKDCPPCEDRYDFQADVKMLVKVCCDQGEAPAELRAKLREILF